MPEDVSVVLHFPYERVQQTIKKLCSVSEQTIWYEHPPVAREVRHCHGFIKGLSVTRQTFRDWLEAELNMKPGKDCLITNKIIKGEKKGQNVGIECISYFHKGQYPCVFKHNIDDETQKKYEEISFTPPPKSSTGSSKQSHTDKQLAKKGLTHWDIVEYVREKAFKQIVLTKDSFGYMVEEEAFSDYEQIYKLLIDKLEECKIKTHQSDLERWFVTIIRNDASAANAVKRNILAKFTK